MLIDSIIHGCISRNVKLNSYLERILLILPKFGLVRFFHILRNLNVEADKAANKGAILPLGSLNSTIYGKEMHPMP